MPGDDDGGDDDNGDDDGGDDGGAPAETIMLLNARCSPTHPPFTIFSIILVNRPTS